MRLKTESRVDAPLLAAAPVVCCRCRAALCLRKQVLNLVLGKTEAMVCLSCLSLETGRSESEILRDCASYVLARECFARQWNRYKSVEYCPDRQGCLPGICFAVQAP